VVVVAPPVVNEGSNEGSTIKLPAKSTAFPEAVFPDHVYGWVTVRREVRYRHPVRSAIHKH
jgi:hypothetical protein